MSCCDKSSGLPCMVCSLATPQQRSALLRMDAAGCLLLMRNANENTFLLQHRSPCSSQVLFRFAQPLPRDVASPFHAPLSATSPITPPCPPSPVALAVLANTPFTNPPTPLHPLTPYTESCGLIVWWRSTSSGESAEKWTRLATAVASLPPPSKDQRQHPTRHDEGTAGAGLCFMPKDCWGRRV